MRIFSFAMESTRYCNYNKDKFNNEIACIIPSTLDISEGSYKLGWNTWDSINRKVISVIYQSPGWKTWYKLSDPEGAFIMPLILSEKTYTHLINDCDWKPQQARQVLPNALKTELVMTGFLSDWRHFFELRCAPSAHPDAQYLAKELLKELYNRYPDTFKDLYEKFISTDTLEDTTN